MSPMTMLRWILDASDWITMPVSLAVWIITAGLIYRAWMTDPGDTTAGDAWFAALFAGFVAGLAWPWLLCFGVPAALGLGGIWGLAALVAHPPRRRRPLPPAAHWTDTLPADTPMERVIELAEQRATERQRPNPPRREVR